MGSRLLFLLVAAFFVTMNVLLWRSEFGARHGLGGGIPVVTVWHKMLVAPDNSRLEIRRHGRKIGYGTWSPILGERAAAANRNLEEVSPEGMIRELSGYSIDFGGNFSVDNRSRVRFGFDLKLATNHQWQEFNLHLGVRPQPPAKASFYDLHSTAVGEKVKFTGDDGSGRIEEIFTFADLQNPEELFKQLGYPLNPGMMAALGLAGNSSRTNPAALGLTWEASNDWLKIGRARIRAYRLQARVGPFQMVLFISLEGAILRVELPDEIVLINDQLTIL
jgi:hypothetical protein